MRRIRGPTSGLEGARGAASGLIHRGPASGLIRGPTLGLGEVRRPASELAGGRGGGVFGLLGCGVWGFRVWGLGLGFGGWGVGCGVWGVGFEVGGLGFGVWGLGFRREESGSGGGKRFRRRETVQERQGSPWAHNRPTS
ncbi:hypothetical protein T484DRAFT_2579669 [Baffinella frigidus]|nr:hypothetical protein T484DRAFT_2579669 [Cryptophyta sp. CCMP2293]